LKILDEFRFKNIMRLKSSEFIFDLFDVSKFLASENNLSDGVDVAGTAK